MNKRNYNAVDTKNSNRKESINTHNRNNNNSNNNNNINDNNINIAIHALEALKQSQTHLAQAEAMLEAQKGKVLFADAVAARTDSILVSELAKELKQGGVEIGEYRLHDWLRGNGYMIRSACGRTLPSQRSMDLGVMELEHTVHVNAYGKSSVTLTPKITPKGHDYFFQKVMADKDRINALEAEKKAAQKEAKKQRAKEVKIQKQQAQEIAQAG